MEIPRALSPVPQTITTVVYYFVHVSSGLTLNVEVGEGPSVSPAGRNRTYLVKAAILYQDVILDVTLTHVHVNHVVMTWNNTLSLRAPGAWIMLTGQSLRFSPDEGVEIDVTRHAHSQGNEPGFLNVEIQNEAKLSPASSGLLGKKAPCSDGLLPSLSSLWYFKEGNINTVALLRPRACQQHLCLTRFLSLSQVSLCTKPFICTK